jgi:hypothetical protein
VEKRRKGKAMEKEGDKEGESDEQESEQEEGTGVAGDVQRQEAVPMLEHTVLLEAGLSSGIVESGATPDSGGTAHTHEEPASTQIAQQPGSPVARSPMEKEPQRDETEDAAPDHPPDQPAVPKKRTPVTVPASTVELRARGPWGTVPPKAVFRMGGGLQ